MMRPLRINRGEYGGKVMVFVGGRLLMPGGMVETKRAKDVSAWKSAIFLLDTGAQMNSISPVAAAQVTKVYGDSTAWASGR